MSEADCQMEGLISSFVATILPKKNDLAISFCAEAIGNLNIADEKIITELIVILQGKHSAYTKAFVVEALDKITPKAVRATSVLRKMLSAKEIYLRNEVVQTLEKILAFTS